MGRGGAQAGRRPVKSVPSRDIVAANTQQRALGNRAFTQQTGQRFPVSLRGSVAKLPNTAGKQGPLQGVTEMGAPSPLTIGPRMGPAQHRGSFRRQAFLGPRAAPGLRKPRWPLGNSRLLGRPLL